MQQGSGTLTFKCGFCGLQFEAEPSRTEPMPERDYLPFEYFAQCRDCKHECPQAHWEVNLAKAWAAPRSPEGIAAVTANLKPPTPEQAQRTRLNAMKHGAFAKVAQYFPARPGKYPQCETCEHFNNGCNERPRKDHKNPPACLKRIERTMLYQLAYETRDPKLLLPDQAFLQAQLRQMVDDMILTVIQDTGGTGRFKVPDWYHDKEGGFHLATYYKGEGGQIYEAPPATDDDDEMGKKALRRAGIALPIPAELHQEIIYKITEHPLIKHIIDLIKQNGWTLPDSGMTVKVQEDAEQVRGFLSQDAQAQESSLEYQQRSTQALESLAALIDRSKTRQGRDPVLLEHERLDQETGSGEAVP